MNIGISGIVKAMVIADYMSYVSTISSAIGVTVADRNSCGKYSV